MFPVYEEKKRKDDRSDRAALKEIPTQSVK